MARVEHDDLHDYGLDRVQRRIFFGIDGLTEDGDYSAFTAKTVDTVIRNMNILVSDNPKKPLELHIGSCGGLIYDALRLVDYIENCPCQVIFYGSGCVMSAASVIMSVCDERYLYRNCQVMLHNLSDGYEGGLTDFQISLRHDESLQNTLNNIYANNSRMPRAFYDELLQRDLYMKPEEVIMLGLADFIVEPKKRGNLRKKRQAVLAKHPDARKLKQLVDKLNKRTLRHKIEDVKVSVPVDECDPEIIIDHSELPRSEATPVPVADSEISSKLS